MGRAALPVLLAALALAAAGRGSAAPEPAPTDVERRRILRLSPLPPPPPSSTNAAADDPRAAWLGQALFHDARLSVDGTRSCATCHDPARSFADGRAVPAGVVRRPRNTPALWNVAHERWLFRDGRADSLWAQALEPIERPDELGSTRVRAVRLVHDDAPMRAAYEAVFGALPPLGDAARFPADARPVADEPDHPHDRAWRSMAEADRAAVDRAFANVGKAIEAYERRLVSRRSPFDVFVEGLREDDAAKRAALAPAARRGVRLFVGRGECWLCHSGPRLSDGEFHDVRVPPRGGGAPTDPGRLEGIARLRSSPFNAAGPHSDDPEGAAAERLAYLATGPHLWGAFRTPSLRNVARTAPYMHQGQLATLRDVLEHYSTLEHALPADDHDETVLAPRLFTEAELADLEAFLRALTDESLPAALLGPPAGGPPGVGW